MLLPLLLVGAPAPAAPLADTPGEKSWAFLVSVLEYADPAAYESFPKEDRRDERLARFLREEAGLPDDHIVLLKDQDATLARVKGELGRLLGRTRPGDLLYLYFAGHGERRKPGITYLVPYDAKERRLGRTAWPVSQALALVERSFQGDRAVLAADACYSGGLCKEARARGRRVSYACFASADPSSGSTGNWTFTDAFLAGLAGGSSADADGDGAVALGELAARIELEMAAREGQLSEWAATGVLGPGSVVSRARRREPAVVVPPTAARAYSDGAPVSAEWDGDWYAAKVTGFKLGLHRVRYDGWSDYWDEWVPVTRLRTR